MKNFISIVSFFVISLVFSNCNLPETDNIPSSELPFFDLKAYFQSEIERLSSMENIKKLTVVDGKKEEKTLESIDFNKELQGFIEADINKVAWYDKFEIDSLIENGQLMQLTYLPTEEKLKTRLLKIQFQNQKVSKIEIEKEASTLLADTKLYLTYEPAQGYTISNQQELMVGDSKSFLAEVRF